MSDPETPSKLRANSASDWDDALYREFATESDRAAVVLTAAMLDNALAQLLRVSLVATASSDDSLLDGANRPLANFGARVDASYRFGLISRRLCRNLHIIRAIRNDFAHNLAGCTFEDGAVRSRVLELARSSRLIDRHPDIRNGRFPPGVRGDFLMLASAMLYWINSSVDRSKSVPPAPDEWIYVEDLHEGKLDELGKGTSSSGRDEP